MDGTTIDSERIYLKANIKASKELGFDIGSNTLSYYMNYSDEELKDVMPCNIGFPNFPCDKYIELSKKYYLEYSNAGEVKLNNGVFELIEFCKNNNIKVCICTSSKRKIAEYELKKFNIYDKLDYLVCGDDVSKEKPSGECHVKALKYFELNEDEAIVIEDAGCGLLAAKDAKIKSILVPGVINLENKWFKFADYVANSLLDVIDIIKKI